MPEQQTKEAKLYAFLVKREGKDQHAWASIYTDRERAEQAFGRVSPVIEVSIPYEGTVIP